MNATMEQPVLGRLFLPEMTRSVFLPVNVAASKPRHMAMFSYVVRSGDNGLANQAGFGFGLVPTDGLIQKWREAEDLQEKFRTADDFINHFGERLRAAADPRFEKYLRTKYAWYHNERTAVGEHIIGKLVWNTTAPASTAGIPARIGLSNASAMAAHQNSVALSSASADVTANDTTNEYTSAGLSRTGALTPTDTYAASLDGQLQEVIANTFTCTSGPQTVYGAGLFDNTTAAFNMYAEATCTSATLQTNDTLSATWTVKC